MHDLKPEIWKFNHLSIFYILLEIIKVIREPDSSEEYFKGNSLNKDALNLYINHKDQYN